MLGIDKLINGAVSGVATGSGIGGGLGLNQFTGFGDQISGGLGNIFNEITGGAAKDRAIGAQTAGVNSANQALSDSLASQRNYLQPYSVAGADALSKLAGGNIMDGYKTSDAYNFKLQEGNKGITNAMAARGLGNSGAAMKDLMRFQTGLLAQDQQQYYNNESNRLNTLAGLGSNASTNLANAYGNYGQNVSNNFTGLGNAQAAANIGQYNTLGGLVGQGAGLAAALISDRRLKKNIDPLDKSQLAEMRKFLKGYHFNYLADEHGEGDWMGVMAQDLEKSDLGKSLIKETKEGIKTIDEKKVLSMFLAYFAEAA